MRLGHYVFGGKGAAYGGTVDDQGVHGGVADLGPVGAGVGRIVNSVRRLRVRHYLDLDNNRALKPTPLPGGSEAMSLCGTYSNQRYDIYHDDGFSPGKRTSRRSGASGRTALSGASGSGEGLSTSRYGAFSAVACSRTALPGSGVPNALRSTCSRSRARPGSCACRARPRGGRRRRRFWPRKCSRRLRMRSGFS